MARSISGGDNHVDDSSELNLPELNEKTQAILRNMIHQQLDEIRTGNAYVEHELQPDCFSKLLVDNEVYSKFEVMTAKNWMDVDLMANHESGLNGGKLNKKKKQYVSAIRAESDFVRRMIEQYTSSHESPNGGEHAGGRDAHHNTEVDTVSSLSESKVSSSSHKRKKKSKKHKKKKQKEKKKSRKSKKRKKDQSSEESSDDVDMEDGESRTTSLTEGGHNRKYEQRKARFEEEKKIVLRSIPNNVKNNFRELGFAKWNKDWLPVMFLGPYDVAPGPVRDQWMDMKKKTKNNRSSLSRLVFWYGTSEDDMANAYSFIPEKNTVSYKVGCKQNYNVIPQRIQKKLDKQKSLHTNEQLIVSGLRDIEKDSKLQPNERVPWIFDFEEEYEVSDEDDEENEDLILEEKRKEKEITIKKKKKRKANDEVEDDSKKSLKKKAKRRKKSDEKFEETKKKIANHSRDLDEEIMEEVAQEDALLQEDAPSEDDVGDDDFSVQEESDSDEEDDLYKEKQIKQPEKPKVEKPKIEKPTKKAKPVKMKETEVKSIKAKKTKTKVNLSARIEEEQRCFEECERIFCPMMTKLKQENLNNEKAEQQLNKILREVTLLTPAFIKIYQVGLLIKDVRNRYKGDNNLNQLCKSITSNMKMLYKEKMKTVPTEFIPKVKKQIPKTKPKKQVPEPDTMKSSVVSMSPSLKEDDQSTQESTIKELTIPKKSTPSIVERKSQMLGFGSPSAERTQVEIANTEKAKLPQKKFSLMGIMTQSKQTPSNSIEVEVGKEITKSNNNTQHAQKTTLPKWILNYDSISSKNFQANIDRELAMDFFNAAVACLPREKIDPLSVATALEDALFAKYEGLTEAYWDQVHFICAALAGKEKLGQLAQKIINGEYATPVDVINVPKKFFIQSFEGF